MKPIEKRALEMKITHEKACILIKTTRTLGQIDKLITGFFLYCYFEMHLI